MSKTKSSGFDIDSSTVDDRQLADNVAEDVIEYSRGNIITNERQSYLTLLGWLTGYFDEEERYTNSVVIGSSSGGKTHLVSNMKQLLPDNSYYSATSGSEKSFIDDSTWNDKNCAVLSEFQKLPSEIIEFIKSVDGGDGGYEYARSVPDDSDGATQGDRTTKKITKKALPYSFTYAAYSMDFELWNRLLKVYISEGEVVNRSVAKMHSGHENISVEENVNGGIGGGETEREYIYDTDALKLALKRHHRSLPRDARVRLGEWMYYAYEPILDLKRSESKRSSKMIPNLVRASALQNYHSRQTTEVEVNGRTVEEIIAEPQDLANVLSTRKVLLGTTHELEVRKQSLVEAVRANTEMSEYCSINDIQAWISENATQISRMKKTQLRELLEELSSDFVVEISERHFDSGAHGYRFLSLSDVGSPKLTGFNESVINYSSNQPLLGVDNPDAPFKNSFDPFKDISFEDSVKQFRKSLKRSVSTAASTAMGNGSSGADENSGEQTQNTLSGGAVADTTTITDDVTAVVYDRCTDVDGAEYEANVSHEDVLQLSDDGLLDPTHSVYRNTDVTSQGAAYSATEDAFSSLLDDGVVDIVGIDDGRIRIEVSDVEVDA